MLRGKDEMNPTAIIRGGAPETRYSAVLQHLIDPEDCIRCHSCVNCCPRQAIVDVGPVLAVEPDRCGGCRACTADCPTGAIDHWIAIGSGAFWSVEEQQTWGALPFVGLGE